MKKTIILFFIGCLIIGCSRHDNVTFEGDISGGEGKFLTISRTCAGETQFTDSVLIRNGHFELTLPADVNGPSFYRISLRADNAFTTLADQGETITINADASSLARTYSTSGSQNAKQMQELDHQLALFADSTEQLTAMYEFYCDNDSIRAAIENAYLTIKENHTHFLRHFISQNSNSISCFAAFYQRYNQCVFIPEKENIDLLKSIYERLNTLYPNNGDVQWVGQHLNEISGQ